MAKKVVKTRERKFGLMGPLFNLRCSLKWTWTVSAFLVRHVRARLHPARASFAPVSIIVRVRAPLRRPDEEVRVCLAKKLRVQKVFRRPRRALHRPANCQRIKFGQRKRYKRYKDGWLLWEIAPAIGVLIEGLLIRKKNRLSDRKIVRKQLLPMIWINLSSRQ